MIAIRLPDDIERRLAELARTTGKTKAFYVREAILEYLDDLEDIYLAGKRPGGYHSRKSRASSITDLERELALAD
jgi:RHH-type rel operon transcriptional repressor/antitoxin RelB